MGLNKSESEIQKHISGVVYPEWNEDIHVIEELPGEIEGWQRYGGIDFGYTNPFVYLLGCTDPDGRLYIVDEHYKSRMLIKNHAEIIKRKNDNHIVNIVADHDAQDIAELRVYGITMKKAQRAITVGIKAVASRLKVQPDGKPRLYVLEKCKNTIREFGCYSWRSQKDGVNMAEEPSKYDDHCPDAVRYMVMNIEWRKQNEKKIRGRDSETYPGISEPSTWCICLETKCW